MNIKAVFFDIDGTFYDHISDRVLPESLQTLKELQQNGYKVCLCSGREKKMAEKLNVLQIFPWDGYIGDSGACVYDENMNTLYENFLTQEQSKQIFEVAKENGISVHSRGDVEFMSEPLNEYSKFVFDEYNYPIPNVDVWHGEPLVSLCAYEKKEYDWNIFLQIEGIRIETTSSLPVYFMKIDTNKANGIHILMKHWGFEPNAYMAFGDSLNDIEMIQDAQLGMVMGNACDELKAYADHVIGESDTPTIYNTLKEFHLI